jgi:hypothetical protein
MERRFDERHEVQFGATVTVAGEQRHSAVGRVSDISKSGLSVGLPFQLKPGEMVEIEMADSTLYGLVIYSRRDNSVFHTGIELIQVLLGETGVASVLKRVLMETLPEISGLEPTEAHLG